MSYLNFDKTLLINLERSLSKEMIRTNRAGAYNSTTLIDCNTRKYHGQLVLPLSGELPEDNYVLLGSLDETVIQHGAEFNLGLHKYGWNNFSPNGHTCIDSLHIGGGALAHNFAFETLSSIPQRT